jgi:plastocyanin
MVLSPVRSPPHRLQPDRLQLRRRRHLPRGRPRPHLLPTSIRPLMALVVQTGVLVTMIVCRVRNIFLPFPKRVFIAAAECMATYGRPPSTYTPPTATHAVGVTGTGATHTIIVAPTQGVLRYVPFAVNASIGDTIKFVWGANNHTVTRSSALLPCNRTEQSPFTSGRQDKDFICEFLIRYVLYIYISHNPPFNQSPRL